MDTILVANSGSSSVKFQIYGISAGDALTRTVKGQVDGVGSRPRLKASDASGAVLVDRTFDPDVVADVPAALGAAGSWLREELQIHPVAIGHRVVHGGPEFVAPVRITPEIVDRLERYVSLAPLHQPFNLGPIRTILGRFPDLPQVACFDTAFHRSHAAVTDCYALPRSFYDEGIRRYGFHGLSYEYIASALPVAAPEVARGRVVVAHLGSGASMCAMSDGQSVESSMGFSALDGLVMGTRPGQLDPGVILYLIAEKGMTAAQVQQMLYRDCGLKGLSGISNDMRELLASNDPAAAFAIEHFVHRAGLFAGQLAAALQGIDAFVFTAGIGERSAPIRTAIAAKLRWLGVRLDARANDANEQLISRPDSRVKVLVIPTDEELMIARHTLAVLGAGRTVN